MVEKIVLVSEDFPPKTGGIAQWAAGVAHGFHDLGRQVTVVTRRWTNKLPEAAHDPDCFSLRYVHGNHWKKLRTWYWRRAIAELYKEGINPDLLIATTWNAARGVLDIAARNKTRTAVVVHGLEITRRMGFVKTWWCGHTLRIADAVIAVSAFTGRRTAELFPYVAGKITVIPNGVDTARFRPGIDSAALRSRLGLGDHRVLLTLARIVERKGHDQVIRALPAILQKVPDLMYCIAGDPQGGCVETLKRLSVQLHVEDHVRFCGYVEPADLPAFYNLCDAYIMPSREIPSSGDSEGFGITFLEANACEKPVIGGNSGGVADAIVAGETGFLVDPLNPAAIAEKSILLLTNDSLAQKLGRQGRERIAKGYTWRAIVEKMIKQIFSHGEHRGHGEKQ